MSPLIDRLKQSVINRLGPGVLLRLGRHNRGRRRIGVRYLRGAGVEIGALSQPLIISPDIRVRYVDRMSRAEASVEFPFLSPVHLVDPSYIGDGFTLDFLADGTQDFVIANHVLEHAPDPIGVLSSWTRVLRPGGTLFVTVPLAAQSFDRGRTITQLDHLILDHAAVCDGDLDLFWERSRDHYREWLDISCVNAEGVTPSPAERERRFRDLIAQRTEIHFHCFDLSSYRRLIEHFATSVAPQMQVREVTRNRTEVIAVLEKAVAETNRARQC